MEKKRIEILFHINTYNSLVKINSLALLRRKDSGVSGDTLSCTLTLKTNKEFKNLETIMLLAARAGLAKEFDQCLKNSKGNVKFILPDVEAEFYTTCTKDGTREYKYVDCNFGTPERKFMKRYYINDIQDELITSHFFEIDGEFIKVEESEVAVENEESEIEGE